MKGSISLEGSAFFKSPIQPKDDKFPYLQLHLFSHEFGSGPSYRNTSKTNFNMNDEVIHKFKYIFETSCS